MTSWASTLEPKTCIAKSGDQPLGHKLGHPKSGAQILRPEIWADHLPLAFLSFTKLSMLAMPALVRGAEGKGPHGHGHAGDSSLSSASRSRIVVVSSGGGKLPVPLQALCG